MNLKKVLILIFLVGLFLYSCKTDSSFERIVIRNPNLKDSLFLKVESTFRPTKKELFLIDSLFQSGYIDLFGIVGDPPTVEEILRFGHLQFVYYKTGFGERTVFVNHLCKLPEGLLEEVLYKELVLVDDGGMCIWSGYINLENKKVRFRFN